MMVTGAEFRDPARFQQVATQPALSRERMTAYVGAAQAATGRTLLRSGTASPGATPARPVLQEPFHGQAPFQGPTPTLERAQRPVQDGQGARTREASPVPSDSGVSRPRDERVRPAPRTAKEERPPEDSRTTSAGSQHPVHAEPHPVPPVHPAPDPHSSVREAPKAAPKEAAREHK